MSVRRPRIKKPQIPKIKKPLISKRKRLVKKLPTFGKKNVMPKTPSLQTHSKNKTRHKVTLGTCFIRKNCKGILSKKVSQNQCLELGGKSWRKIEGTCKNL